MNDEKLVNDDRNRLILHTETLRTLAEGLRCEHAITLTDPVGCCREPHLP